MTPPKACSIRACPVPDVAVTPKSLPFAEGFKAKFGNYPSYAGYTSYDEVYYIADAIKRAGSTDADKLVEALEKTDWEGTIGRIQFYGKDDPVHPFDQIRQGPDHRPDAAVAGRQAGQRLAEGSRQRPVEVPKLHQGHVELNSNDHAPGLAREHFRICSFPE